MSESFTDHWIAEGEADYACWFRRVYLVRRWERWHVNGSGISGLIPSQQRIESHHAVTKMTCAPSTRASTAGVVDGIIPHILRYDGENLCFDRVYHFGVAPVLPEMMTKAATLLSNTRNYRKVFRGRGASKQLKAIIFNVRKHMVGSAGILECDVDAARARTFVMSLDGNIPRRVTAQELEYEVLSLHCVWVGSHKPTEALELAPQWSGEVICTVREQLQCTCESYVRSGWVCSHVLACLALEELLDIRAAMTKVPGRRAPGRPRARRSALEREEDGDGYFSVSRLVALFLKRSGQPLGWKVVDDFPVIKQGEAENSNFVGQVSGVRLSHGLFVWSVRFDDETIRDYEAEHLANVVRKAHILGVNDAG